MKPRPRVSRLDVMRLDIEEIGAIGPIMRVLMSRPKKSKATSARKASEGNPLLRRILFHSIFTICFAGAASAGFYFLKSHVDKKLTFSRIPPRIVLKDRPLWMSDFLAEQIARSARPAGAHSSFDHQLLIDTQRMLSTNPWVRNVREVRRAYTNRPGDTLEIDCDFRAPVALVKWKDYYWLVDRDGVKLPEQFTADQIERVMIDPTGNRQIRVIEGVSNAPVETGRKWPGEDLSAGLALAMTISSQPYANSIVAVDVTNFAGRIDRREAQLVLLTRDHTRVYWGQPVNSKSFFVEARDAVKLDNLAKVFAKFGRVDMGLPWVDARFDEIHYPRPQETARTPQQ